MSEEEYNTRAPLHLFNENQQTLIKQNVPAKFFDKENLDPILETLDMIPDLDDPEFETRIMEMTNGEIEALDVISRGLNDNLLHNYELYLKSMQMISELNRQLNTTSSNVRQTRQIMLSVDSEICDHPRAFFRQITKQQNLDKVLELITEVDTIYKSKDNIDKALAEKNFKKALDLCKGKDDLREEVRNLSGVEDLFKALQGIKDEIMNKMDKALFEITGQFDRAVYENLMVSYASLKRTAQVPQKLQQDFLDRTAEAQGRIKLGADLTKPKVYHRVYQQTIEALCSLLSVHREIVLWHRGAEEYEDIRQAVEGVGRALWDSHEGQVTALLLRAPVERLNFDTFDELLKLTAGFIQFGASIVDLPGGQLMQAMDQITTRYFKLFHRGSIDAVREVLETDNFAGIPSDVKFERQILSLAIPIKESADGITGSRGPSGMTAVNIQPAFTFDHSRTSNSCSYVLKRIHQYLTLMKAVPALAAETFKGIQQLVEFYGLSALHLFLRVSPLKPLEMSPGGKIVFSSQYGVLLAPDAVQCLQRIVHHFQEAQMVFPTEGMVSPQPMEAVGQAATASDDMRGIAWYLRSVRPVLEETLPEGSLGGLRRFFSDVVSIFLERFTHFCFQFFGPSLLNLTEFEAQMRSTKWTLSEPPEEPHPFTRTWTEAAKQFGSIIAEVVLPGDYKDAVWLAMWDYTSFSFLNGLAAATKCTSEGRTAMLSDYRNMSHDFMNMTERRLQADQSWVAAFVQAYFLGPEEFKKWAGENSKRYTMGQLLSVVETGFSEGIKRNERKDLNTFIRGLYQGASG